LRATEAPIMTLEQLRVFVAVAERLHMTQAAAAVNLTQSAASAAIHALETRLDTALFDRIGKRLELTEAGRVLLPEAKAILSKALGAEQALAELRGLLRGHLRLWASQTIGGYWLPPYLYRFHAAHPGVTIELKIANSLQVSRAVLSGEADLGFVDGDIDEPILVQVSVAVDQLVVVVAKSHELATLKAVELDDLRRASWVLLEKGAGTRQVFERALRQSGVDPAQLNVVMELPTNETVRSLVEAGAGVTVLPRVVVADKLSAGTLVEVPFRRVERRYVAIRHGDRRRGRAESVLLDMMRPASSRKSDRGPARPPSK
jgi:DNA-binding transcriptional LysR family regulator